MANVTAAMVKQLRELTGAGVLACKNALVDCDGDIDKAVDVLRKKGEATAVKKASRIAAEGIVSVVVKDNTAVIVEVNSETDFVAKNEKFQQFVADVVESIFASQAADVEALLEDKFAADPSKTVREALVSIIATIGEKITIRRFERIEGVCDSYIHMGGKIGVLLQVSSKEDAAAVHDVAMQIAAAKPTCIDKADCNQEELDHEREVLRAQAMNEPKPKPAAIIERMVEGRIEKYYKEVCLLEQPFVKNQDQSVREMIGGRFEVARFIRYEMGEGLQKREDNFADEVMAQANKNK